MRFFFLVKSLQCVTCLLVIWLLVGQTRLCGVFIAAPYVPLPSRKPSTPFHPESEATTQSSDGFTSFDSSNFSETSALTISDFNRSSVTERTATSSASGTSNTSSVFFNSTSTAVLERPTASYRGRVAREAVSIGIPGVPDASGKEIGIQWYFPPATIVALSTFTCYDLRWSDVACFHLALAGRESPCEAMSFYFVPVIILFVDLLTIVTTMICLCAGHESLSKVMVCDIFHFTFWMVAGALVLHRFEHWDVTWGNIYASPPDQFFPEPPTEWTIALWVIFGGLLWFGFEGFYVRSLYDEITLVRHRKNWQLITRSEVSVREWRSKMWSEAVFVQVVLSLAVPLHARRHIALQFSHRPRSAIYASAGTQVYALCGGETTLDDANHLHATLQDAKALKILSDYNVLQRGKQIKKVFHLPKSKVGNCAEFEFHSFLYDFDSSSFHWIFKCVSHRSAKYSMWVKVGLVTLAAAAIALPLFMVLANYLTIERILLRICKVDASEREAVEKAMKETAAIMPEPPWKLQTVGPTPRRFTPARFTPTRFTPTPSRPTPGRPTPGMPTPGMPTPGKPSSSRSTSSKSSSNRSTPGKLVPYRGAGQVFNPYRPRASPGARRPLTTPQLKRSGRSIAMP